MSNDTTTKTPARIEFLTDVLCTAVEGGVGYWSRASNYAWSTEDVSARGVTLSVPVEDVSANDFRVEVGFGLIELGYEDIPVYVVRVTLSDIATGLGFIARGEAGVADDYVSRIRSASIENDAGEIDAGDADIVIQAAIFGKVIFG